MTPEQVSNWECKSCGKVMFDYAAVGYDGPGDGQGNPACESNAPECSPFMNWVVLCHGCATAQLEADV